MKYEIMELIDDLSVAALRWELAKDNMKKSEAEYKELLNRFNETIEAVSWDELLADEELFDKIIFADKVFKSFNIKKKKRK